ncbi:Fcf2 pre-rRNA processing-domain-containing protein [Xylariaceae sp. FL1272]|nr:Fcf2 pre-rRNA processing-domain-containing protein [Xylariaceae sp. FL1272]
MAEETISLSDAEIDELLRGAEQRLQAKQGEQNITTSVATRNAPNAVISNQTAKDLKPAPSANSGGHDLSVRVPVVRKSKQEMNAKVDAGPKWFNLPKTDLTPELRKDLQLLKMRDVLDPKRFYKKDNSRGVPEFSQVGTFIPGPTDYFNSRMTKKERKRTLLEDVLGTEDMNKKFKSKYGEIQAAKTSGKKGHYKKMMQKRYGSKYKG